ncbi:uncharacterized protein LOC122232711 [Panthera tigris]|uniref:uncharacterized protein LOC122232711 n=1 Tax=Panthera tigris TaxID=9694 RepID=UPI001C6FBBBA|nr:uncharacterized protein LOC122232711 [Panthera tigris]
MRESPDPCLQAVGVCRQTQFPAFRCGPRCTVSNLHNRGRERGPCFPIAWSGCVHLAPQAPQAPLWLAAYPRLRRASRLRQACQVMLNPLRPPPPPPPENCHSWSHPRACWETLILSCCDHKPTSFGGLLVSSMRPIHKVICILLGGISSVVLINSERSPLVGAGTASLGGRLWSCTVSMMRASREKELKDAIQGKHHLRPHYAGLPARGWQPHKRMEGTVHTTAQGKVLGATRTLPSPHAYIPRANKPRQNFLPVTASRPPLSPAAIVP